MHEASTAPKRPAIESNVRGWLTPLLIVGAWSTYLPLTWQYLSYLLCAALALYLLGIQGRLLALLRHPLFLLLLSAWLWLALSATWSTASAKDVGVHLWHYGMVLLLPAIGMATPSLVARRALKQFVLASAIVGAIVFTSAVPLLSTAIAAKLVASISGNQRIAVSILLALGTALAMMLASDPGSRTPHRLLWFLVAVPALAGLLLLDRRSGLLTLPVLLVCLALTHRSQAWWRICLVIAAAVASLVVWHSSTAVQLRFAEGLNELRLYHSTGDVTTSWGMRVRMLEVTLELIRQKPLLGHGVGSWVSLWRGLQESGTLLEGHTTPHNEYVLLAAQAGLPGLGLWVVAIAACARHAWTGGRRAQAALLVCASLLWTALFNAVLRDAKFALPLLLLGAVAWAASRMTSNDVPSLGSKGLS